MDHLLTVSLTKALLKRKKGLNPYCNGSSINGTNKNLMFSSNIVLILIVMDHLLTEKEVNSTWLDGHSLNPYCNGSSINGCTCNNPWLWIECVLILIVMDHLLTGGMQAAIAMLYRS